jgi:hypothetical protein
MKMTGWKPVLLLYMHIVWEIILEGNLERVAMPFFTTDFTDKMGLIYQISGSPNWQMP